MSRKRALENGQRRDCKQHVAAHIVSGNMVRCDCGHTWSSPTDAEKLTQQLLHRKPHHVA